MKRRLLALLLLGGCVAAPPAFEPAASRSAAVSWSSPPREASAAVAFETGAGGALRLVVTAGRPVLVLTRRAGEWTAHGPGLGRAWRGSWNTAPGLVGAWMSVAEAYEGAASAPAGESEIRTGRFSVRYDKRGAELRAFELVDAATGTRFRAAFR